MLKKFAITALLLSVAAAGAACSSSNDKDAGAAPSPSAAAAAAAENPDAYKLSAYTAARLSEEKIDILFHTNKKDDKPVLNTLIASDKEKAAKFLNAYFDPALTDKILTHYLTADKASDGSVIVKADKFLPVSFLKAAPGKDDVTYEGTQAEVKMTTKDNGVFTVKKNAEGKYILSDVTKK